MNHFCQCWGAGFHGALGIGGTDEIHFGGHPGEMGSNLQPLNFGNNFTPVLLSVGDETSCAVSASHRCRCWGRGAYGLTGQGNNEDVYAPTNVLLGGGFDVEFVSVGYLSACAVSTNGEMKVCFPL